MFMGFFWGGGYGKGFRTSARVLETRARVLKRFRGGLVVKAHILSVSLNSRLESNKEEDDVSHLGQSLGDAGARIEAIVEEHI